MFHLCSHDGANAGHGAKPGLEGAYALRQPLSAGAALHTEVRLPQAAGPRDAGSDKRAELPTGEAGRAFDVPSLRKQETDGGL
jgi:hypothetical protein